MGVLLRWTALAALLVANATAAGSAANRTTLARAAEFPGSLAPRLLAAHNAERARKGVAPLAWDSRLAAAAAAYGPALASHGGLRHSPGSARPGQLENLWMGTRGAFSPEQMVSSWIAERAAYRAGIFPAVSRTGRWSDVAHYTQIIWPTTTHVGCAVHRALHWDYLICRYSPPGNVVDRQTP